MRPSLSVLDCGCDMPSYLKLLLCLDFPTIMVSNLKLQAIKSLSIIVAFVQEILSPQQKLIRKVATELLTRNLPWLSFKCSLFTQSLGVSL